MVMTTDSLPLPISEQNTFADLLRQRLGLVIPADRLAACLRRLGYDSSSVARTALRDESLDSAVWQRLLRELAIGETYFFRSAPQLEAAIQSVYSHFDLADSRPSTFTAWSAGCATGEEAYTLAILLRAVLPLDWTIRVIGTDINAQALATARRGYYTSWSFRSVDALSRGGLIADGTDRWRVPDALRALVEFRLLNLTDTDAIYPTADLIVCRNVLLYLSPSARNRVRERLPTAVKTGGALVIDDAPLPSAKTAAAMINSVPDDGSLLDPGPAPSLYERARVLTDDGQIDAALDLLQSGSPLDLACAWLRAQIYMQGTKYPPIEVLRAVQRCLYIDPSFALGYVALGNLYATQGDQRSARRQWANAARIAAESAPEEALPFGEGLTAGDLHSVIGGYKREV